MRAIRFASSILLTAILCTVAIQGQQTPGKTETFRLHDGDTVVFYGDSITEQKLYTSDIENFVLTRFPKLQIHFVHSGVGGDKVSGGWAGPIDMRLMRDVVAYHPAMVTVMLGMNDGYYRPYDPEIQATYEAGYRHLVNRLQAELPQAELTLIKPSPFDDATRDPEWEGGYNGTMVHFGDFVGNLAAERKTLLADLNQPVVTVLTAAKAADAPLSRLLMQDRVHPGTGIHWIMAESILRTWSAPSLVDSLRIDAAHAKVTDAAGTTVIQLQSTKTGLTWTEQDGALPLPLPPSASDPYVALVLRVSDLTQNLNQESLQVDGLPDGQYELRIDERVVGTFTATELGAGVSLATLDTPMLRQSRLVAMETDEKNSLESERFQLAYDLRKPDVAETVKRLDTAIAAAIGQQHKDAQPAPHRYAIVRVAQAAAK